MKRVKYLGHMPGEIRGGLNPAGSSEGIGGDGTRY
jgi:hypothetical protein